MGQSEYERRRFPRAELPCKIVVDSLNKLFATHTVNISEGGIRVVLRSKIEPLSLVNMELMLENETRISCKGKVAWVLERDDPAEKGARLYDTGIGFQEISDRDRIKLKEMIDKILLPDRD